MERTHSSVNDINHLMTSYCERDIAKQKLKEQYNALPSINKMVDTSRSRFNKSLNTRQTANLLLNEKFFRS